MSIWNNRGMIVTVTFVITLAIIRHLCEVIGWIFFRVFWKQFCWFNIEKCPKESQILSDNGELSQEPSKSYPSQKVQLRSKSISRKLFQSFSVTFFVVSTERRRLTTSFRQTEDENDSCKKVIHLLVRTDKTEFFQQSVLLKYF